LSFSFSLFNLIELGVTLILILIFCWLWKKFVTTLLIRKLRETIL
jgi:hypothetical protein